MPPGVDQTEPKAHSLAERAGFEDANGCLQSSQTASFRGVEREAILPNTPVRDGADHSGTDARAALIASLIASLAEHVRTLTAVGDLAAAKVAAEALVRIIDAK